MTVQPIRRIAINTGGGDAPGLNAVIRAATLAALRRGWECVGIRDGFNGLLTPEDFPHGGLMPLTRESVAGISHLGGTILGTTNHGNPSCYPVRQPDGTVIERDRTGDLVERIRAAGLDALITVGGDGSLAIGNRLAQLGLRVIGVPKTIDNDLDRTFMTFGFDSAVSFATECLDRLHSTATAHRRLMVVEVMGRYAGWIALHAGIAGGANVILIPEIPFEIQRVADWITRREHEGRMSSMVVVAEGARPVGGAISVLGRAPGEAERLGGVGEKVAHSLEKLTGKDTRLVVLGHLLRGGSPTSFDRLMALRFGAAAVRALEQGENAVMVALAPPSVQYVPLSEVVRRVKVVPLSTDTLATARDLGICFGDDPAALPATSVGGGLPPAE
ncbi:MAG TPA: ATP-dependent 6-phosphofructokinase [Candidatus Sulfotelmatobacter sp.]|nr:ATP-dependent 6-phosphofructokinase [Candidatus Sulfotelmatobacter sp.]